MHAEEEQKETLSTASTPFDSSKIALVFQAYIMACFGPHIVPSSSGYFSGHSAIRVVNGGALLSRHATFSLSQLALTGQQFLSLLIDFTLHLDLDLSKLLFLAT